MLTPLTDEELAIFGNQELWEDMPSIDELDIDTTATRTFGSTELSRGLRRPFHADTSRYTRVFPSHTVNDTDYSEDNSYVYVMTPCQFNNAHASKDAGQLLELDC